MIWAFVLFADLLSDDVDVPAWLNMILAVAVAFTAIDDKERIKRWLRLR